jgi:hypothetical protein
MKQETDEYVRSVLATKLVSSAATARECLLVVRYS